MKKVHIFYSGFVTDDGSSVTLGGVQTYLINLTKIFNEKGFEVHYYRPSSMNFETSHYNILMHGYECKGKDNIKRIKMTFKHFSSRINPNEDLVLFADDILSCKATGYNVLALQHGIFWDIPDNRAMSSSVYFWKDAFDRFIGSIKRLIHSTYFKTMVCVDYNYVNWYRTWMPYPKTKLVVIPNFAPLFPIATKPSNRVNIIFARRFEQYRGSRVFGTAIKRVLEEYKEVYVTLAGWGSDEKWLHNQLNEYNERVEFTTYKSEDCYNIHADKHIAVVPTVGSEGTSLSLLEAMSSQCAVVCSDVGGMTNIVLDGYNGLMVPSGDSDKLYQAIKYLVENASERQIISQRGYDSIMNCFSFDIWKRKWSSIIQEIIENK